MVPTTQAEFAEFRQAILRSEKVRTLCMIVVVCAFALLGLFRILTPMDGRPAIGICILGYSVAFLVFEILMLRQLHRAIKDSRQVPHWLFTPQLVFECLLPLGVMYALMLEEPLQGCLGPGDLIVAVSDGFFEWADQAGEEFGIERLQEVIRAHRHESAQAILAAMEQAVREFVGNLPQQDDVTGLIIQRLSD